MPMMRAPCSATKRAELGLGAEAVAQPVAQHPFIPFHSSELPLQVEERLDVGRAGQTHLE
jgi:hypothetical protein